MKIDTVFLTTRYIHVELEIGGVSFNPSFFVLFSSSSSSLRGTENKSMTISKQSFVLTFFQTCQCLQSLLSRHKRVPRWNAGVWRVSYSSCFVLFPLLLTILKAYRKPKLTIPSSTTTLHTLYTSWSNYRRKKVTKADVSNVTQKFGQTNPLRVE